MDTLIAIAQSPWSERARWALDHHGLPYSEQAHAPILGELSLRRKVGRWRGPVSVPILVREGRAIHGSHAIARLADSAGRGPSLFGQAREEAIARWSSIAEQGASAGRALSLLRIMQDEDCLRTLAPAALRRHGRLAVGVARLGTRAFMAKYGIRAEAASREAASLDAALRALRRGIETRPGAAPALLGEFSYADICAASLVNILQRPSHLKMDDALRRVYRDPDRCATHGDLLQWRDALVAAHRGL